MVGKAVLFTIIVISGIIFLFSQVEAIQESANPEASPIVPAALVTIDRPASIAAAPPAKEQPEWFVFDDESRWTADELAAVNQVLDHTFQALDEVGLDGQLLLAEYRFTRVSGEHMDEALGLVGLVNHDTHIISLADAAFVRLGGFYIYHELGHAVDHQLGRVLSDNFHARAAEMAGVADSEGGQVVLENEGAGWQTANGYWLRAHAREVREEATADAFALWVGGEQANMRRPIFAGTPLNADYDGIGEALEVAILAVNGG